MPFVFKPTDIKKLEKVLGVPSKKKGANYRFELTSHDPGRSLSLEIYPGIAIGRQKGNLVSVYTPSTHLQLHFCSGYVVSGMLGEVTFVGEHDGKLSGLIIEKEGGCSLYANVDRALLSGDFTQLGPEVMLSGIALSLTDMILDSGNDSKTGPAGKKEEGDTQPAMIRVQVFNAHGRYRLAKKPVVQYVNRVMKGERKKSAAVSVIFIDSKSCRKLNKQYLNHDYVTDVISFELQGGPDLEGEVYVNLDRAKQQARSYRVSFSNETARLVIHGTLHLAGYMDITSFGRKQMRTLENRYLKHWFSNVKVEE